MLYFYELANGYCSQIDHSNLAEAVTGKLSLTELLNDIYIEHAQRAGDYGYDMRENPVTLIYRIQNDVMIPIYEAVAPQISQSEDKFLLDHSSVERMFACVGGFVILVLLILWLT